MLKKNGGITLIALVITIIVLLILAGVSIAMLTGTNGLLTRSTEAADKQKIAGAKDVISTDVAALGADWYEEKYVKNTTGLAEKDAYVATKLSYTGGTVQGCTISVDTANKKIRVYVSGAKKDDVAAEATINADASLTWSWSKVTQAEAGA